MTDLFSEPFEDPERASHAAAADRTSRPVGLRADGIDPRPLESELRGFWVEGEISNCRIWNTGHLYFTLKDGGAQIKAVMFRSAVRYLKFKLEDGQQVIARGRLGVYDRKGEYQLVVRHVEPRGLGALQAGLRAAEAAAAAEGLFDAGAQASPAGASRADRDRHLARRRRAARPPPGPHAGARRARTSSFARRACRATGAAARDRRRRRAWPRVQEVDVVIVGRGGGRAEDLWAFNEDAGGARDRRLPGAGRLGRRPRGRLHDCRPRRRPAGPDTVGGGRDGDWRQNGLLARGSITSRNAPASSADGYSSAG